MDKYKRLEKYPMSHFMKSPKHGESVIAFLPIKPIYAIKIIDGIKRYEFRRTSIKADLTHIIIYATFPIKKIIAVAEVARVGASSRWATWNRTKHAAGLSRTDFMGYFDGINKAIAIELKTIIPLDNSVTPHEIIHDFKVPQSFKYVDQTFLEGVLKKGLREGQA